MKKQQRPPSTQRPSPHRYIVLPSFNCSYAGAVRWKRCGQEMQQDAKPLEKAFRSLWKPNYSSVSHGCQYGCRGSTGCVLAVTCFRSHLFAMQRSATVTISNET